MRRDLSTLAGTTFDVLVIGAGIYGVATAWDAALRGLSVALIDRGDIGGATSANSLKTIHGGLRSLQRGALGDMRQFIRERRALMRIAPHLVRPLQFVIPTSRHPVRNAAVMRIALLLNDLIASDRNDGLLPSHRLAGGSLLSRADMQRLAPDLDPATYTGGATWWDGQMLNSERLTLAFAQSAAARGACVANYVGAERLLVRNARVDGARVRDAATGAVFDVRAKVTVNAAGAWASRLSTEAVGAGGVPMAPALSRAMNVVVPRPSAAGDPAVGGLSDGRFFFRVPWRGITMFGTSHDPFSGSPDASRPSAADVQRLLDDVNRAFPGAPVRLDDVSLVHSGILPASHVRGDHVELLKDSVVRDHRHDGLSGLVTVIGVRYTTARQTGETVVDLAAAQLGTALPASAGPITPLVGGDIGEPGDLRGLVLKGWPSATAADTDRLARCYGSRLVEVTSLMRDAPALADPLSAECPVTRAEIAFSASREAALTLIDAIVRRTEAGSGGHPGQEAAEAAAAVMAAIHQWDAARRAGELDALADYYRMPPDTDTPGTTRLHPAAGLL